MAIADRAVYPTQPHSLHHKIRSLLSRAEATPIEGELLALIVPDSNLLSGADVAAQIYRLLEGRTYETVILISPSHTGSFRRMNICGIDRYKTPLGDVPVNDQLRNELCDEDDDIYVDDEGHFHTEGVDVQLPFLQEVLPSFDIVPIIMGEESPEFCRELGSAVGEIMFNRKALVIATVDVVRAGQEEIERIGTHLAARDVNRLMAYLNSDDVEIEGKGSLLVALIAALSRRATDARVFAFTPPKGEEPGALGAAIWRSA